MEMEKTEKFYNLTEVARILRVSPITVRRWVEEKKLRAFHPPGTRLYRIPETALREFAGPEWFETMVAPTAAAVAAEASQKGRRRRRR